MSKTTPTPHDALFKVFLTHPDTARDFLQLHLPSPLLKACDLDTLRLESGSFIEDDLRASYSDVLYSLKTTRGDGYVYALIEHQSSPDKTMAFRLLKYSIAAMQRHLEAGHERLPLVIPILFYHGQTSPYPYSLDWLALFDEPHLAKQLYGDAFPLVDVTVIPDDDIMQHRRMAVLELLQKHVRQRDLAELLEQLVTLLLAGYTTDEQLGSLLNYMLQVGETRNPADLLATLATRVPHYEENIMTIAERLKEEGRAQGIAIGIEQGIEQGIEKGERQAAIKIARTLLASGLDQVTVMNATGLSAEELAQIRH